MEAVNRKAARNEHSPPRFPDRWGLSEPDLIADTFSSRIWKVRLPDGGPAIVKDLKPIEDIADELRGADYLTWRDGRGAARLLDRDGHRMLLEYAGERRLADVVAEQSDDEATEIAAELMVELHAPGQAALLSRLLPVRERFQALFERGEQDRAAGAHSPYAEAAALADRLFASAGTIAGLHGDLHHENIMLSQRGWLVIDPVGLAGEAGFGAANMFYDPVDRDDLCFSPRRIAFMAQAFARALGVDPRRLLDQAHVYGCLSAAWNAGAGAEDDERRDLTIARLIGQVRDRDF